MEFFTIKNITAIVAIALTFIGYAPYFRDLLKGKTKPHLFSWFIWAIVTSIIYALQVSAGAGFGSLVTLAVAVISFFIFILGFKNGNKNIKKIDVVFLVLALLAIPLWLLVKQPIISIILLSTIDMLGFAPTVRKSWNDPYSETLSLYAITTLRHGLSIIALEHYNIVTLLFPSTWVIANALFSIMLIARRKKD
jgi:hypothetical protein